MCERIHDLLVGQHVGEETNAKRERPDHVTDEFDQKDQRRNPPNRPGEVLQVPENSVFFDTDIVVVKKRRDAECKRHAGRRSRRDEQREESHQV